MGKYGEFIKAMQEKYAGVTGQGLDGVPLTAVAPSGLMGRGNGGGRVMVPSGDGAGTGVRSMGRSNAAVRQADKPAGIVEEDEMVIEAPMVDRMGGPKEARDGIEVLADMKKKGVARSFQTGTGDEVAGVAGNGATPTFAPKARKTPKRSQEELKSASAGGDQTIRWSDKHGWMDQEDYDTNYGVASTFTGNKVANTGDRSGVIAQKEGMNANSTAGAGTVARDPSATGDVNSAWADWKKKANYAEATHGTEASLRPTFDKWYGQYGKSGKDFNSGMNQSDWAANYGGTTSGTSTTGGTTGGAPAGGTTGQPGTIGADGKWIPATSESLGVDKAPTFKTADEITRGMQRPDSKYETTTDEAMAELKKLSTGGSEAMKAVGDVATRGLAGQQAARSSALNQNLAQQGVEGGAARVAQAMESRQAGTEQSKLRSDLAIENQARMERATESLVNAGFRGQELENAKYQVDVGIKQWGEDYERLTKQWGADFQQRNAQFVQNVNQWGQTYAFEREKHDYSKTQDTINAAFAAGDLDTVSKLYKDLGVDIDMTRLTDKQARDDVTNAMDDFLTYGNQLGFDSPEAQAGLEAKYKLEHPEQYDENGKLKPEFQEAHNTSLKDTTSRTTIKTSKTRSAIAEMMPRNADGTLTAKGKENVKLFMSTMNIPDISKFSFNGETGEEAAIDFYTAWIEIDGFAESLNDPDSPASQALSSARGATDSGTDPKAYSTDDFVSQIWGKDAGTPQSKLDFLNKKQPGDEVTSDSGAKTWVKQNDGTWKQKATGTPSEAIESQAGYSLTSGDPMGSVADQILKQGRTNKNSVAYDAIVKGRVENMAEKKDYSSLKGMKSSDPIYKAVLQKTTQTPMATTYRQATKGLNKEFYGIDLPAGTEAGSPMNIEGKLYTLSKQLPDNRIDQTWPKLNKHEMRIEVIDTTTGEKKILKAGSNNKVTWEK